MKPGRLAKLFSRAGATREELVALDEQESQQARGTVPIGEVQARQKVHLSGTLQALTYYPRSASPQLSALLFDGTGSIELVWMGRREIPGIEPGKHISVDGTVLSSGGRIRIMNPSYRILPRGGS